MTEEKVPLMVRLADPIDYPERFTPPDETREGYIFQTLHVRLGEDQKAIIRDQAEELGISPDDIMRIALERYSYRAIEAYILTLRENQNG
ncbi:hypothetical protein HY379_00925 [Candidatus Saccharibacteria bacterium]|nr:hypothetical protein [Candidatus Saccharibacteria bacterium]